MIIISIIIILIIYQYIENYKKSSYCIITKNSFLQMLLDKGKFGEYLTYKKLKFYERDGNKFLFNLYLPILDNKTTELDLIMITKKGIIVFESKNYSGWIFGDETSKMWMQTLPNGKGKSYKSQFFNPILQNKGHINSLKKILNVDIPIFSIIVFSKRCVLKKVPENTNSIKIINRENVNIAINEIYKENPDIIKEGKIISLYSELYKYTQVEKSVKEEHITNIQNKYKSK